MLAGRKLRCHAGYLTGNGKEKPKAIKDVCRKNIKYPGLVGEVLGGRHREPSREG